MNANQTPINARRSRRLAQLEVANVRRPPQSPRLDKWGPRGILPRGQLGGSLVLIERPPRISQVDRVLGGAKVVLSRLRASGGGCERKQSGQRRDSTNRAAPKPKIPSHHWQKSELTSTHFASSVQRTHVLSGGLLSRQNKTSEL